VPSAPVDGAISTRSSAVGTTFTLGIRQEVIVSLARDHGVATRHLVHSHDLQRPGGWYRQRVAAIDERERLGESQAAPLPQPEPLVDITFRLR